MLTNALNRMVLLTVLLFTIVVGCSKRVPDGVPAMVPATIKVVLKGEPIPEVRIQLVGEGPLGQNSVGGKTDDRGIATCRTVRDTWVGTGIPVGQYRVVLQPTIHVDGELPRDEFKSMTQTEYSNYISRIEAAKAKVPRPFPESFGDVKKTPLRLEVTRESRELIVNLDENLP